MANESLNIGKSLSFTGLASPPSDPYVGELYQNLSGAILQWNGSSWIPFGAGGGGAANVAVASCSTGQSLVAATQINFDTVLFDPLSQITTGASWKFTPVLKGFYEVYFQVLMSTTTSNNASIFKNGLDYTDQYPFGSFRDLSSSYNQFFNTAVLQLDPGASDYIDIRPNNTAGAIYGASIYTRVIIKYLGSY